MSKYAIFSFETMPIGIVVWSPDLQWYTIRFARLDEGIKPDYVPFLTLVQDWLSGFDLGFREVYPQPYEDDWGNYIRQLLNHEIRLSEPKPLNCNDPRNLVEPIYLAVTAEHRSLFPELKNVQIAFGLEAQRHIPAIETMLAEGKDWKEIGNRIGCQL